VTGVVSRALTWPEPNGNRRSPCSPGSHPPCAGPPAPPSGILPKKGSYDGGIVRRSSAGSGGNRSVAEVARIELEWQALSCCYRTNQGDKWVLKDIYGAAQPGEMQVREPGMAKDAINRLMYEYVWRFCTKQN
jgi:hypothetical protein